MLTYIHSLHSQTKHYWYKPNSNLCWMQMLKNKLVKLVLNIKLVPNISEVQPHKQIRTNTHTDLNATSSCVKPQAFRSAEFSLTSRAALSLANSSLSWVALFMAAVCVSSSFLHAHSSSVTDCNCLLTWRRAQAEKKTFLYTTSL